MPGHQVGLQEDVFQKLLEAAWVLQELQDSKDSRQLPFQFFSPPPDPNVQTAPQVMKDARVTSALASAVASAAARPTLLGSLMMREDTFTEYGLEPPETEPATEAPDESVGRVDKTADTSPKKNARQWPVLRLRLKANPDQILRMAATVVLLVGAYAMFQTRAHKPSQAVAAMTNSTDTAKSQNTTTAAGTLASKTTLPAKNETLPASRPTPLSPAVSSHKQVTDLTTQNALHSLSKFEMRTLRRQAQFGDDAAALTLGMAYETGYNVKQNCKSAAEWVTRAAKGGDAAAEYNLGLRYEVGDGVPVDQELAAMWIRKSALRKYTQAQSLLASPATL
jgi:hypothetical protein